MNSNFNEENKEDLRPSHGLVDHESKDQQNVPASKNRNRPWPHVREEDHEAIIQNYIKTQNAAINESDSHQNSIEPESNPQVRQLPLMKDGYEKIPSNQNGIRRIDGENESHPHPNLSCHEAQREEQHSSPSSTPKKLKATRIGPFKSNGLSSRKMKTKQPKMLDEEKVLKMLWGETKEQNLGRA